MPKKCTKPTTPLTRREQDLIRLANFRLMDDTFMSAALDNAIEAVTLILRMILDKPDLIVTSVKSQSTYSNVLEHSVTMDVTAEDASGKVYDIEIQRTNDGANPKRARYHSSMIDTKLLPKGKDAQSLKDTYVIFITEHDFFRENQPLYYIERCILNKHYALFNDGAHILYVNGAYQDLRHPIGQLMHDFMCTNADDMLLAPLAKRVRFLKETQKGVTRMCQIMDDLRRETIEETTLEKAIELAQLMLADKQSIDLIIRYTHLTAEQIEDIRLQMQKDE